MGPPFGWDRSQQGRCSSRVTSCLTVAMAGWLGAEVSWWERRHLVLVTLQATPVTSCLFLHCFPPMILSATHCLSMLESHGEMWSSGSCDLTDGCQLCLISFGNLYQIFRFFSEFFSTKSNAAINILVHVPYLLYVRVSLGIKIHMSSTLLGNAK